MRRIAATTWLLLVLLGITHVLYTTSNGLPFQTDVLALLPREDTDSSLQKTKDKITQGLMGKVLITARHQNRDHVRAAAIAMEQELRERGLIAPQDQPMSMNSFKELGMAYFGFRNGLLSEADRQALLNHDGKPIVDRALSQIFGFAGIVDGQLLIRDPFLLFPAFLNSLPVPQSNLNFDEGLLTASQDDGYHILINSQVTGSPASLSFQKEFIASFEKIKTLYPDVEWLRLGGVFFAHASTVSAMKETTLISSLSILLTIVILILSFRSIVPIVFCLVAILIGMVCATSVSLLLFGSIHVAAQLFGASLIGVSVDYAIIYFGQIFSRRSSATERLAFVFPGLFLGMLTTVAGYISLAVAPFPGLYQVAIFSSIGLLSSFLTVILWFPLLDKTKNLTINATLQIMAEKIWQFWKHPQFRTIRFIFVTILLGTAAAGYSQFRIVDDIRQQQNLNQILVQEQAKIQSLVGFRQDSQFFIVKAPSTEEALQLEEALGERLADLKARSALAQWISVSSYIPSQKRQFENRQLISAFMDHHMSEHLALLGVDHAELSDTNDFLLPEHIWTAQFSKFLDNLILTQDPATRTHLVFIERPSDFKALSQATAGLTGVTFIDPTAEYTALFKAYRERSVLLLIASAFLMLPFLAWRYGWRGGAIVLIPPLLALVVTPGLLALAGQAFTFFSAIALVLMLAMGVDYAIFCAEDQGRADPIVLISVGLAMLTAFISFGLLGMSDVAAVRSFGLTMAVGLPIAYSLAPIGGIARRRGQE